MKIVRYRNPPRSLAVGITYVPFVGAFPKIAPSTLPPLLASLARPMNRDDSVNASPIRCPPLVAPNETVAIPPTSLPKSKVIDEFVPESRVGCPERTFCGLATDPEVPCTAVGRTVRDVGERVSASMAPGGAATAASAAGNGCRPSWAAVDGTAETLARPSTSKAMATLAVRGDVPRIEYLPDRNQWGGVTVSRSCGGQVMITVPDPETREFTDLNGRAVHAFAQRRRRAGRWRADPGPAGRRRVLS